MLRRSVLHQVDSEAHQPIAPPGLRRKPATSLLVQCSDSTVPNATSGAIAGPIVKADLRTIYLNDLTLYGCSFTPLAVFSELVGSAPAPQQSTLAWPLISFCF